MATNYVRFTAKNGINNNSKTIINVDTPVNTTDATNKTYVDTALALKVDVVAGKGLSTQDYTSAEQTKLAGISGTNTGDETSATIKTKLGITTLSGSNTGDQTTITGNAGSATVLQTPRAINGVSFDGSSAITINAIDATARIASSTIGAANGVCPLGSDSKVAAAYLPSYVDDVVEYAALASFPASGSAGIIYVDLTTNKIYRWSGTVYIEVSPVAGNADTATKLATARTVAMSGDVVWSVSFDGSANVTAAGTLATVATAGTYKSVTVNAKGLVTAGTNPTTLAGYGITDAQSSNANLTSVAGLSSASTGLVKLTNGVASFDSNTYLTANQSISVTGDATGTGTTGIALTLANSGVTVGTYSSVTVDAKGRVTAGSKIATLDYGTITSYTLTTSATTANQVIASIPAATYRTAKLLVSVTSGSSYHTAELLLIHDGASVSLTEYSSIFTGVSLLTLDADILSGNIRLLATPTNAVTTIKVIGTLIIV